MENEEIAADVCINEEEMEKLIKELPDILKELEEQSTVSSNKNINILVVDDSSFSRRMIIKELTEIGFSNQHIMQSDSGKDALEKLQSQQFDLFILDIVMVEIDGIAVLKEVKKNQPNAKVIMCSGSNSIELIKDLIDLGIDAFIVKPYKSEDFKRAVCRSLPTLEHSNNTNNYLVAKCHICNHEMIEVNLINTLIFYCPNNCMQIGPLANALVTQQELDKDYEDAVRGRKKEE